MKDDGGPAFPWAVCDASGEITGDKGMSLWDWYAGRAPVEVLDSDLTYHDAAEAAACYADAMIAQRRKRQHQQEQCDD